MQTSILQTDKVFYYGANPNKKCARIHFRANTNNLFLTLTDMHNCVIYTRSTGMCTEEKNKRQQLSTYVIQQMAIDIAIKLNHIQVYNIEIYMRTHAKRLFKNFITHLKHTRINLTTIIDVRRIPHNGVRGRARARK